LAIFFKELKIEFRNWQMITSSMLMSLMILAAFRFAFVNSDIDYIDVAAPILWITFFFSGMFALAPIYKRDIEQGTKDGLILAPISPPSIFYGKFLATLSIILLLEAFTLVLFFIFFPVDMPDMLALCTMILLGTIGFVALGNLISAISANLSKTEILLVVLLIPILLFTIIRSTLIGTSEIFINGADIVGVQDEIKFIIAFDIVYLIAGHLLIRFILED
jgi:heme exporter protein B